MFETLLRNISASAIRHAATSLGALLVADGFATMSDEQQLIGCAVWLTTFAFTAYDKWQAKKKLDAAKAS